MYEQDVTTTTTSEPNSGSGVQGKAKQAGEAAKQGAQEVAGTAKEQGREVAREAKHQARSVASDVRRSVQGQARNQNQRLAQGLRQAADQFHEMGPGDDSPAGQVVRRLGETGRRTADYLEDRGPEGMLEDVQEFARRKPGTFLLIAAAAGFVVGRLGRAAVAASQDDSSQASGLTAPDAYPEGDGVYRSATATEGYPAGGTGVYATGSTAYPTETYADTAATGYPGTGQPAGTAYPSTYDADQAGVVPPAEPYPTEPYPTERPR